MPLDCFPWLDSAHQYVPISDAPSHNWFSRRAFRTSYTGLGILHLENWQTRLEEEYLGHTEVIGILVILTR